MQIRILIALILTASWPLTAWSNSNANLPAADGGYVMLQNGFSQTSPGHEGWVLHPDNTRQWVDAACRLQLEQAGITVRVVKYAVIGAYPETGRWMNCEDIASAIVPANPDSPDDGIDLDGYVMMQNGPDETSPGNQGWVRHPDNTRQWVDAGCRVTLETAGMPVRIVKYEVIGGYPKTGNWMKCADIVAAIEAGDDVDPGSAMVMLQHSRSQPSPGSQGWVKYQNNTRQWVDPVCRETLEAAGMPVQIVSFDVISSYPKTSNWQSCLAIRLAMDENNGGSSSGGSSGSSGSGGSGGSSGSSGSSGGNSSGSSGGNGSSSGGDPALRAAISVSANNLPDVRSFVAGTSQASAAQAEIVNDSKGTSNNFADLEGAFRIQCKITEDSHQDPIVKWGQKNAAHHHLFFGNAQIDEYSTNDTSVSSSQNIQRQPLYRYSCHGGRANQSGYWAPVIYDQSGKPRMPQGMISVYYKTVAGQSGANLKSFPSGLQIVAGNPGATEPKTNWGLRIGCRGGGYTPTIQPTRFQYCDPSSQMVDMFVRFPNCWNGVDLTDVDNDSDPSNDDTDDEADPHSHMRYGSGSCPASHPVQFPIVSYNFRYELRPGDDSSRWYLSSDVAHSSGELNRPGGSSWHADWMNGWDPAVMEEWMDGCVRPNRHCSNGDMGQRKLLSPPPGPRSGDISDYDADRDASFTHNRPMNHGRSDWVVEVNACNSRGRGDLRYLFGAQLSCETRSGRNNIVTLNGAQLGNNGQELSGCGTHRLDLATLGQSAGFTTINGKTPCTLNSLSVEVTDVDGNTDRADWVR